MSINCCNVLDSLLVIEPLIIIIPPFLLEIEVLVVGNNYGGNDNVVELSVG